ncbi:hypothetical protein HYALB_00006106 [Hymenoscyphus albidus]|uniref:Uncharacterized protein n=1 Tax=Hymenoscyphus albidus TaxID=595503 RepID=A0A9N9LY08_9HELO|nr:hypothetical protein HYALB_00006106 [Hymenoscyphus albidus]
MDRWKGATRNACFPAKEATCGRISITKSSRIGTSDLWLSATDCVGLSIGEIKHVRVELVDSKGKEDEDFWYGRNGSDSYSEAREALLRFPKLESVDFLVPQFYEYARLMEDWWGRRHYPRVVDMSTGEWVDQEAVGPYRYCIDSACARSWGYDTDDADEEESNWQLGWDEDRIEDMKELQMPRPRINLDYQ